MRPVDHYNDVYRDHSLRLDLLAALELKKLMISILSMAIVDRITVEYTLVTIVD